MIFQNSTLKTLILTNFILTIFLISLILFFMSFWFWTRVQNVRKELRSGKDNSIFPIISDKPTNLASDKSVKREPTPPSVSPSSCLAQSLTSADFVAKSLLDKKVFAASGHVYKSPSAGLKDLI